MDNARGKAALRKSSFYNLDLTKEAGAWGDIRQVLRIVLGRFPRRSRQQRTALIQGIRRS